MTISRTSGNADRSARYWYAIYTRPRFEKKVNTELLGKGLQAFLPLRSVTKYWSDRRKKVDEPLFPSYVFVCANLRERYDSLQSRGVIRMVSFAGRPARIPEDQIQSIHRILEHGYDPEPFDYLTRGDQVAVVSGPLRGMKGIFLERRGQNRLVISIDAIRQSVAVEIERGHLRRLGPSEFLQRPKHRSRYRLQSLQNV
ncbi:MAG: UpxY family transcription antiterminator [bacterium]